MSELVNIQTAIVEREDGWWTVVRVDGVYQPGADVGPFNTRAEAEIGLADLRKMIDSVSPKRGDA